MRKSVRKGLAYVLTAAIAVSGLAVQSPQQREVQAAETNYQLVWQDEFEGTSLNRNYWNVEVNGDGGGNGELQYYIDDEDNIKVSNGTLKITALKESYGGKNYTSGRINTNNKVSLQYGRYEARMKLPKFEGAWPAFWTLGENYDQISWPNCGEIDIMEAINAEDKVYGTAHWSYNWSATEQGMGYNIDRTQWHVYAMEWDAREIRWYVDDVNYYTLPISYEAQMEELAGPQFIIFNLAIGGSWPGYTVDDSAFPNSSTMEVDYVRVYEDVNNTDPKFQAATKDSNWHSYGNWDVLVDNSFGSSTAQVATDPKNGDHIQVQQLTSTWDDAWTLQARYTKSGLIPGQKYRISVDLKSNSTDGQYMTDARDDGAAVTLLNGTRTITRTVEADSNGEIYITFGLGWVGTSVVLDFSNVYCRVYDPNEIIAVDDTMEFISVTKDGALHKQGNWQIQVGAESGSQAKVAVDATDANHIQVQHSQADWNAAYPWSVMARYTATGLTPGQTYTISVRMLTSSTDGSYVSDAVEGQSETTTQYINGVRYVTKTGTADSKGELYFSFGFGYSGVGVIIDFDDVSVTSGSTGVSGTSWNYQAATADDNLHSYGDWQVYIGASWSGSQANIAVDPSDSSHISLVPTASTWVDAWSLQAKYTKKGLTPGTKYKLTMEMTSTSSDGSYITDALPEDQRLATPLHVGTKTITKIAEADSNGELYLTYGLGYSGVGITYEFDNIQVVEYTETVTPNPGGSEDETTQAPNYGTNVALGKTATSSTSESDAYAAGYAVDGNADTRWASAFTNDEWIMVDLGTGYLIDTVVLTWESAYGTAYNIQISTDGNTWTTVRELTGQNGGEDVITFNEVSARYVKMQGVTRATQFGFSLYEMAVYGEEDPNYVDASITVNNKVKVEGYQISYMLKGYRVVSSIEPEIDGKKVVKTGNVYGLATAGVKANDVVLESDNQYVANFESTTIGLLDQQLGASSTANYYAMTMVNNGTTADAYNAKYIVRAYAILEDGTVLYSDAKEYSIYSIADKLYTKTLMSNLAGHEYLYNDILKIVDSNYKEIEYDWDNALAK